MDFTKEELIAMNALIKYVANDYYSTLSKMGIVVSDDVKRGIFHLRSKIKYAIHEKEKD